MKASKRALRDSVKELTVKLRESTWDCKSLRGDSCGEGLESAGGGGTVVFGLEDESLDLRDLRYFA